MGGVSKPDRSEPSVLGFVIVPVVLVVSEFIGFEFVVVDEVVIAEVVVSVFVVFVRGCRRCVRHRSSNCKSFLYT